GEGWLAETRRATLVAWGFLTIGIVLGAWWSYSVFGWGGFWAGDPVENASPLPWLTATAFIHSVMVQERRGMLRVWNLSLVIATFCLTILGTFLTRSGVLNSVHAFSQSSIGAWLLTFLGLAAATGLGLIAWRGDRLRTPGRIDSPVSREGAFLANNLLFAGFAFLGVRGVAELAAFGLGAFAVAGIVRQYALGVAATRRAAAGAGSGVGWVGALRRTVAGNRRLYGGLVVHVGVVVIAVALAASMGYTTKREFHLAPGERGSLHGYHFTYLGTATHETGQKTTIQ